MAVSGLARKFWTITSCTARNSWRHLAQGEDRLGPLGQRLADADQQAGGERDRQAPGVLEHPEPDVGVLVGRAVVGLALGLEEPAGGGLEHHPHRGGDRLEPVELLPRHHAGVEVGQQPGLLQHPHRHRPDVGQRRVVALLVEPLLGLGPAVLRPVAEREQRLQAAQLGALPGDVEDLVGGEEHRVAGAPQLARRLDERAVVALVAAQLGDRDEHLGRVGDHAPPIDTRPAATSPASRTFAAAAVSRSRSAPVAARRAVASPRSSAAPRSARASARRTCWGVGASGMVIQANRAWSRGIPRATRWNVF